MFNFFAGIIIQRKRFEAGCSSVWLERSVGDAEVARSNRATLTTEDEPCKVQGPLGTR
jgi:hypothetical protein